MPKPKTVVEGFQKAVAELRRRAARALKDGTATCTVGYTAPYALIVHEDMQTYHSSGQAQYLLLPALTMERETVRTVQAMVSQGKTVAQALLRAGLAIEKASKRLVPVDTGRLKNSSFTHIQKGVVK